MLPPPNPASHPAALLQAELKSQKAAEALRRAVDKYNTARNDFEQRMVESATVCVCGGGSGGGTTGGGGGTGSITAGMRCWRGEGCGHGDVVVAQRM